MSVKLRGLDESIIDAPAIRQKVVCNLRTKIYRQRARLPIKALEWVLMICIGAFIGLSHGFDKPLFITTVVLSVSLGFAQYVLSKRLRAELREAVASYENAVAADK